jgi:hypothetical protein
LALSNMASRFGISAVQRKAHIAESTLDIWAAVEIAWIRVERVVWVLAREIVVDMAVVEWRM